MCHVLCMESVQSCVDFLIVLFMDCVQILVMATELQEDWLGTKVISISLCLLSLFAGIPLLGAAGRNPGHGTKIARGLDGYTRYQSATLIPVIYIYKFASAWRHEMSRHQNCKRCSLYQFI